MRTIWISLCVILMIAFIDAQRNFYLSKPVVSLENRARPLTWQKTPEERRKLSIFPRNNKKFTVTQKTVPKTEEEALGLPTRRTVMRKFIVQDKNEKGAWYFAPREPLMKTKRFTVTLAPHKLSEIRDNLKTFTNKQDVEIGAESTRIKSVVSNFKNERMNKFQINKENLINGFQNKKINLTTSKGFKSVEKVVQDAKLNKFVGNSFPHNYALKENKPKIVSSKIAKEITRISNELEEQNKSLKVIQTPSLRIDDMLNETIEDRSLDLNEMELIDKTDNKLKLKARINNKTNDVMELLIKNIMNDTENVSISTPFHDTNINEYINIANHTTNDTIEDDPHELDMKPNIFYDGKSLDNVEKYFQDPLGSEDIKVLSGMENLNFTEYLNENSKNTLIMDGLESFIEYTESNPSTDNKHKDVIGGKTLVQSELDLDKYIFEDYTREPITITNKTKTSTFDPTTNLNNGPQTELPREFISNQIGNPSTENVIVERGTSNPLNSEEILPKASMDESIIEISGDFNNEQSNKIDRVSEEVIIDESNNLTSEDISNESSIERSNNFTDEDISSEFMANNSNNLPGEEISNKSNMASAEVSNESVIINLTDEEISDESLLDKSNNLASEDVSNESIVESKNMSAEQIPTEAPVKYKRSNNIIEEDNQATTISSFKYTGQPTRLSQDLRFKNINA